jgi:hypothetical protein
VAVLTMSWRRFVILLTGLSPESRWTLAFQQDNQGPRVIDDPDEAERYFASIGR